MPGRLSVAHASLTIEEATAFLVDALDTECPLTELVQAPRIQDVLGSALEAAAERGSEHAQPIKAVLDTASQ